MRRKIIFTAILIIYIVGCRATYIKAIDVVGHKAYGMISKDKKEKEKESD